MNGPEHYVRAGELLATADNLPADEAAQQIAAAAVHAQLAAVAVQALSADTHMPDEDFAAWDEVAGVPAAQEPAGSLHPNLADIPGDCP